MKEYQKNNTIICSLRPGLYRDDHLTTVRLPQKGFSSQCGMFYSTFSTNRLYHAIEVGNIAVNNKNIMQIEQ